MSHIPQQDNHETYRHHVCSIIIIHVKLTLSLHLIMMYAYYVDGNPSLRPLIYYSTVTSILLQSR